MSLRDLNGFPDSEHGTETDGNVLFSTGTAYSIYYKQ